MRRTAELTSGNGLAERCRSAYEAIRAQAGHDAAERWYWEQHVELCRDTHHHGCRAKLGPLQDSPRITRPTVEGLSDQATICRGQGQPLSRDEPRCESSEG